MESTSDNVSVIIEGIKVDKGLSGKDKQVFSQCIKQMMGEVDNQRYLLVNRKNRNALDGFYCVPDCFATNKNDAEMFAKLICFAFYLLLPTTNIRPEITGNGIWEQMVVWLYQIDMPSNLFPSIHCLVSWFCFIGVRGRNDISKWYQSFSFLMAVAVFVSTLTTKQHVLVDVIGGVGIAEFCYWVSGRRNIGEKTDIYSEKN